MSFKNTPPRRNIQQYIFQYTQVLPSHFGFNLKGSFLSIFLPRSCLSWSSFMEINKRCFIHSLNSNNLSGVISLHPTSEPKVPTDFSLIASCLSFLKTCLTESVSVYQWEQSRIKEWVTARKNHSFILDSTGIMLYFLPTHIIKGFTDR